MHTVLQDLRFAIRQLRRSPGFALSVVLVLALGIGANAAMFTVLESTLFKPLPYKAPGDLVLLNAYTWHDTQTFPRLADLLVWKQRTHLLDETAYFNADPAYLYAQNTEQKITKVVAGADLFSTLGAVPALGRTFSAAEQQPGRGNVAVLSDAVWRNQFHADPKILGQVVRIDDVPTTVIGVMPRGFLFPASDAPTQVWQPVALDAATLGRATDTPGFKMIARLGHGVTAEEIAAAVNPIQKQLLPLYNDAYGGVFLPARVDAASYRRSLTDKDQRTALLALLGAVAALWLIACANVACLMLARTAARRREMAVRSALGASRWRLTRQTLVESLILSGTACAAGLGLAQATLQFFSHSLTTQLDAHLTLHPDARVLCALVVLSVVSALLFGLVPARLAANANVEQALRQDGAQAGTGRHQQRLQRVLVVCELALTMVLLVSCGLLLRTVFALRKVPLGFRTDHVFVINPKLPDYKYAKLDKNRLVVRPLLERIQTIPGVQSAAMTTVVPLDNSFLMQLSLQLNAKKGDPSAGTILTANMQATGPELQQVLGFSMGRGRYFNEEDTQATADKPIAAVVNSAFAKAYEPANGDMSHFSLSMGGPKGTEPRRIKIVGILDDLHQMGIANPAFPELDLNAAQMRPGDGFYQPTMAHGEVALRSTRDARSLIPELNHVMQQLNPDLAGTEIHTMDQIVDDAMGPQLLAAHLLEALGGLALVVALAGLYSLLAYLVTLRTRELGLRLALGAQRSDILTLILRGAAGLLLMGTAIGIGLSLVTVRVLHSFLFGVAARDTATLIVAAALLLLVGGVAAWLPARHAAAIEPMEALRTE